MNDWLNPPKFTKRISPQKYQVRFWSTKDTYELFSDAVRAEGLVLQGVFNDFMYWFISAHHSDKVLTARAGEKLEKGDVVRKVGATERSSMLCPHGIPMDSIRCLVCYP